MQTFLPCEPVRIHHDITYGMHYHNSFAALDRQRLGKQRVEALQIAKALLGQSAGWQSHPAVKMWAGHLPALIQYGYQCCQVWKSRGYNDTVARSLEVIVDHITTGDPLDYSPPAWMGDPDFHRSHRSNLVRKLPQHYRLLWPVVPDDLPYVWPL